MDGLTWMGGAIERAAVMMAHVMENTPDDKLGWCPAVDESSKCRSMLDQAGECIRVNNGIAARLRGETPPEAGDAPELDGAAARAQLVESAKNLAATARAYDPARLGDQIDLGFAKVPAAAAIEIAYGNMMYHAGQLNQIQLMYGDTEFRIPPGFLD